MEGYDLTLKQRLAVTGKVNGATRAAMARHFGVSAQAVKKRLARARRRGWRDGSLRHSVPHPLRIAQLSVFRCV